MSENFDSTTRFNILPVICRLLHKISTPIFIKNASSVLNGSFFANSDLLLRGRVLGGSSSLNAMVYVRGHAFDQNKWAEICKDETWNYDHFLPYFKKAQGFEGTGDLYRGTDGPLGVSEGQIDNPLYQAFIQAGIEARNCKNKN